MRMRDWHTYVGTSDLPLTRDDLITIGRTSRADDQRHEDAARADGRKNVGHVGHLFRVAQIGLADRQLAKVDKRESHGLAPRERRSRLVLKRGGTGLVSGETRRA